ncbi:MAG: hypothetical protein Q4A01_08045 [Coriobacteriales bacterium]|nr:hypothetical protein [Coriobacteriales bacterium]
MRSGGVLLLKALLLSTSQRNLYRHSKDKRKRRRIVAGTIGYSLLLLCIVAFGILTCFGYGVIGIIDAAPVMCALVVSALTFVLTLFKTNGYLFGFREYDMLLALPFETSTVAACKFMCMYIKSLPWCLSISLSMMVGYGCFAHPAVVVYPVWLVLSLFLPIIPMLVASFAGFVIARVSAGSKKAHVVQTVLTFVFIILCFSLRFIVEGMFENNQVAQTLQMASAATNDAANVYLPARWFASAVTRCDWLALLLLVGVSTLLFVVVFRIVGRSYRTINSALQSHAASKRFTMAEQRQRSVVQAIAHKEYKRLTASTVYMTNGAMGEVLAVLLAIVTLVLGFNNIVGIVTRGAPIDPAIIQPAIPFVVYFCIGMVATTVCSPSLEGKNYWIVQSLPIEKRTLYQGKMLFNLYLTVPFMTFSIVCLCISARVPVLDAVLYVVLGLALCAFSTAWGCVCGIRHMRLDWENEVEVIKQGAAVTIYLLPNMFVTMGLVVLAVFLGTFVAHWLLALAFTLVVSVLAALSYRWVVTR